MNVIYSSTFYNKRKGSHTENINIYQRNNIITVRYNESQVLEIASQLRTQSELFVSRFYGHFMSENRYYYLTYH